MSKADEGQKAITLALFQVWQEVFHVEKDGHNAFHKYDYTSEQGLLEKLRPAMVEAGLMLIPSAHTISTPDEHGNTHVTMEYTLIHKDGHIWPEKIRAYGCGNDKAKSGTVGDKGLYKALTGANKYLLFKMFQISTGDDPENELTDKTDKKKPTKPKPKQETAENADDIPIGKPPEKQKDALDMINDSQRKKLFAASKKAGWSNDELKGYLEGSFGISSTKNIPKGIFNEVLSYIN